MAYQQLILLTLSLLITQTLSNLNNFSPNLTLHGNTTITPISIHFSNPSALITLNTPFNFLSSTSFSTHFIFSLSPHSTLSLFLAPATPHPRQSFDKELSVEFGLGLVTIGNLSVPCTINGDIYQVFVDYWAESRLVEVRVGRQGADFLLHWVTDPNRVPKFIDPTLPVRPLLVFPIDLFGMWEGEEVLVGLQSSSNSSDIYSWRFEARNVPKGMHSMPVDPSVRVRVRARSKDVPCYLTVVSAVMIAAGCCVFVVFMVMFFKVISTDWDEVMEMEYVLKPVGKGYEKVVGVDVENNMYGNVDG